MSRSRFFVLFIFYYSLKTLGTSLINKSLIIPPPAPVKHANNPADIKLSLASIKTVGPIKENIIKKGD